MTRLLALFVVAWAIYQLVEAQLRRLKGLGERVRRQVNPSANPESGAEIRSLGELVPCSSCGVHVARGKVVLGEDSAFCSERCAERVRSGFVH